MNKAAISPGMLRLLVRAYNQSIQSFHFFPEVIIGNSTRFEVHEFNALLNEGFLICIGADSFGKMYRLSAQGEASLKMALRQRRHITKAKTQAHAQTRLVFSEPALNE